MQTKAKLSLIVGIFGVILLATALFLTWNMIATYRLINTVAPAIETFTGLHEIQSGLYRQQHALAHFVVNGEPASRQEFNASRAMIDKHLHGILATVKEQQSRGVAGEDDVEQNLKRVQAGYVSYLEKAENCMQAKIAGRSEEALANLGNLVAPYLETELLDVLRQMSRNETVEIHDDYHELTLKLGGLPWVADLGAKKVEIASNGVDYDLAISQAELGLYRQVTALTAFMLHAETREWKEFWGRMFESRRLLEEWHQVIQRQQAMGVVGEDKDGKQYNDILAQYESILPKMEQAASFRVSMGRPEGLVYVEENVMAPLDTHLFPALIDISRDSREEVKVLHAGLLRTVLIGGVTGLLGVVLLSLVLVLLAQRISNSIIAALARLKSGTEIVKGGDLKHQIALTGDGEFSELAASFNSMTTALKEHNDELRSFVFSVAHDLRAPLVNLKGFSEELRSELATIMPELLAAIGSLPEQERQRVALVLEQTLPEALKYIDAASKKLDSLVNAVLKLSRIGFQQLNLEKIDTEALVAAAVQAFAHTIREKKVTVTLGPLPVVVADRMVMEQCVANLLDNACKYLVPGRAGQVSITAEQTEEQVILYFQDNGRGIVPEDISKVFEIFRRAGKQDTVGEGMGLAFVKALARRQGGNVWCESVPGEGSTFCLAVPLPG